MKAYELLSEPRNWAKYSLAYHEDGKCDPSDFRAISWCMVGAILKCYPDKDQYVKALDKVCDVVGPNIGWFNDKNTYEDVVGLLRKLDI